MEPVIIKVGYLVQAGGGSLPAGTEGQFLAYGAGGVPVAVDAPFGPPDWADITNRPTTFAPSAHTHAYADITGKPTTFPPSAHSHAISEVTGLQTALDGKAASAHTHAIADVTGLQTALDGKQPTTTFKTVNNTAITGTGNIDIPAGPPPPVMVTATVPASPVAGTFYVVTT